MNESTINPAPIADTENATKSIRNPMKAIRVFCLACVGNSRQEVRDCTATPDSRYPCPLYPFRFGRNPYRAAPTDAQRETARKNAERMNASKQIPKNAE